MDNQRIIFRSRSGGRTYSTKLLREAVKPRLFLIVVILCCWNVQNGTTMASASSSHRNLRLRAPSSQNEQPIEQEIIGSAVSLSDETAVVGPFVGNAEAMVPEIRRKKQECGMPSIAARGLVGPSLKRSYFAYSPEEVEEKVRSDKYREKRQVKRNEISDGPLPWTCETKYEWKDMGADHYPRFVRTAECKSRLCFNGFFRCKPRRYKTKVLKRLTGSDSVSCEEDDVSLPETLRSSWRFITVTINLCCDCTGRIPGTTET